jgi:hypothetical protein
MESAEDFGWALVQLRDGRTVSRQNWNGKGMCVELQTPDAHSKMSLPYLYLNYGNNTRVPWAPSQTDVLATDWQIGSN